MKFKKFHKNTKDSIETYIMLPYYRVFAGAACLCGPWKPLLIVCKNVLEQVYAPPNNSNINYNCGN